MNKELQLYYIHAKNQPRSIEEMKHEIFRTHLKQEFDIAGKIKVLSTDFT